MLPRRFHTLPLSAFGFPVPGLGFAASRRARQSRRPNRVSVRTGRLFTASCSPRPLHGSAAVGLGYQAGERMPGGDFHPLIRCARRRTTRRFAPVHPARRHRSEALCARSPSTPSSSRSALRAVTQHAVLVTKRFAPGHTARRHRHEAPCARSPTTPSSSRIALRPVTRPAVLVTKRFAPVTQHAVIVTKRFAPGHPARRPLEEPRTPNKRVQQGAWPSSSEKAKGWPGPS